MHLLDLKEKPNKQTNFQGTLNRYVKNALFLEKHRVTLSLVNNLTNACKPETQSSAKESNVIFFS